MKSLYLLPFVGRRRFNPPTAVAWQSLTANGTSGTVSTTQLTATFDVDPGLTTANFVVTGASKGTVTNVDGDYYINVFDIPVDGQTVTLDLIDIPSSVSITPTVRTVTVYKAAELEAPTFEFDLVFPQLTEGDTGTFDASYCFAGEIDSYSIATGTLPAWLTFNTSTCVFTYTDAEVGTVSGVSITATNLAGSATTNTDDLVTVESVEGQGTISSMPSPYYGSLYTDATGIVVDGIEMIFDDTHAPCHIKAHLNLRLSGARRFSGLPLRETLCHIVWTLTYSDDSALPYHDEIIEEYTQTIINPYTDTYGPVFGVDLFDHGDFKLTGRAYIATSDGMTLFDEATTTFSRAEFDGQYIYYDKINGLNTNDGADPLGLSLTNASYVESTGILTETDAFAGVTLDDDTNTYRINTNRWGSLNVGGETKRVYFAEIIDPSNARIADEYKLGADATGITSSNGPKQFFTGIAATPTTSDRFFLLSGNNADTVHETTQPVNTRGKNGYLAVIGYSGKPVIKPAADTTGFTGGDGLVTFRQTPSTYNSPSNLILNNVVLDGDLRLNPVGGAFGNLDAGLTQFIVRDIIVRNSGGATGFSVQRGNLKPLHLVIRASYFENIRKFTYETTVAVDAFANDTSITVTGALPGTIPSSAAFRFDSDNFAYHYGSSDVSFDGTNTTITIPGQRDPGDGKLEKNYPAGTVVKFSKQIKEPIFASATSFTVLGPSFYGESDKPTYQHNMYPSIYGGNNLFAWGTSNPAGKMGFFYNFNNDSEYVLHRHSFIGNYITGCEYFTDAGNSTNDASQPDKMTGIYVVNNSGNPSEGFILQSIGVDWFVALNNAWMATPKWDNIENGGQERAFFGFLPLDSLRPTIQSVANWDFVVERNNAKNYKAWADRGDPLIYNLALLYNNVEQDQTASNTININTAGANSVVVTGNNFTAPNDADGNYLRINGSTLSLSAFNTAVSGSNTGDPQNWNDPENGDFSPPSGDPELILGGGTKYAAISGFDQSSTNDKISAGDDFDLSYTFKALDTFNFLTILGPGSGTNVVRTSNSTTIRWADNAGTFDFTVPEMTLGQEYQHIWRRRSGVLSLEHNGDVNGTTASTNVILPWSYIARMSATIEGDRIVVKDLTLTDLTSSFTITYNIDGGEVPVDPATSVTVPADVTTGTMDSHSITYHNIDEDDWV